METNYNEIPQQSTEPVVQTGAPSITEQPTKFCKFCGAKIHVDAVLCTACGRQVEQLQQQSANQPQIVINNTNDNINTNTNINATGILGRNPKNKWVAFFLCLFIGYFGAHKFYEGKAGMGLLYIFTVGLLGIGWIIDLITILCKPNPYYV